MKIRCDVDKLQFKRRNSYISNAADDDTSSLGEMNKVKLILDMNCLDLIV